MTEQFCYVSDEAFLKRLDEQRNRIDYIEITVLDLDEAPIQAIQGRVTQGSINVNGDSSVRRTAQLTFVIENRDIAYSEINYLLALNRKVKISKGLRNDIDDRYGKIIGYRQGVFVISQIAVNHAGSAITVTMSCKDKMCLLNGDCGGKLPTSVTFDSYDQLAAIREIGGEAELPNPNLVTVSEYVVYKYTTEKIVIDGGVTKTVNVYRLFDKESFNALDNPGTDWKNSYKTFEKSPYKDGERISIKQRIYDIIQTAVMNYGGESANNIIINDIPLKLKQLVRWTGNGKLYHNIESLVYTNEYDDVIESEGTWRTFNYGEDVGYEWTDFVYPGELVSAIGDSVCSVLDKIISALGNYEYFYNINGQFVFQEKRNFLNMSYLDTEENAYRLDALTGDILAVDDIAIYTKDADEKRLLNELVILDEVNYKAEFAMSNKSVYTFDDNNGLVISYTNSPMYTNINNDFHIWGKNSSDTVIHYHFAIKEKPVITGTRWIEIAKDENDEGIYSEFNIYCEEPYYVRFYDDDSHKEGIPYLTTKEDLLGVEYYTTDWRAQLYMEGLEETQRQQRPDIFKQELLDLFGDIYNFEAHSFRADIVTNPNELTYWFDYLEPVNGMDDISIESIGLRTLTEQKDNVVKLFDAEAPNVVLLNVGADAAERADTIARCRDEGVEYSNVANEVYERISIGTLGYSAQELAREMLYQHISDSNTITLQLVPIYHLEPNTRITVRDVVSDISGDYIIKTISVPLDARNAMTITATAALTRI